MKRFHRGLLIAIIAMSLVIGIVSCGGGSNPTSVVRAFFATAEKGDTKTMQDLCTPETASFLGMFGEKLTESLKEASPDQFKITGTTEKIDGDTATVSVTTADGKTQDIDLKKVDGKWKINIKK